MENKPLMLMIHHTHREWKKYMQKLALESGIPDSYRMIIMYLDRNPGASQKDLAEHCQTTYASVSQTIKDMLASGYIVKKNGEKDQRYKRIYLSEKGQAGVNRIKSKIYEADQIITSALTPEKESDMIKQLELLCETIRKEFTNL